MKPFLLLAIVTTAILAALVLVKNAGCSDCFVGGDCREDYDCGDCVCVDRVCSYGK